MAQHDPMPLTRPFSVFDSGVPRPSGSVHTTGVWEYVCIPAVSCVAWLPVAFCCVHGCTMVIRPLACASSVALLAAGLRPTSASVFPRFSLGNSPSTSRLQEATAWTGDTVSASRRRATALRLEQEGQSRLVPERIIRRGPWGLATVRTVVESGVKHSRFW